MGRASRQREIKKSFKNEVRAMSKLCKRDANPNLVEVFRHGEIPNSVLYYIDMELCNGNLEEYILEHDPSGTNPITIGEVWHIMVQISNGLVFIHDQREVHRDLKPQNGKNPFRVST
jgi:serine/threonine protein kinase